MYEWFSSANLVKLLLVHFFEDTGEFYLNFF